MTGHWPTLAEMPPAPYGAVTAQDSQIAKLGTGAVGSVFSALTVIPVIGPIFGAIGAGLLAASSAFSPERAAAREDMLRQGTTYDFANYFARAQDWPDAKLDEKERTLQERLNKNPMSRRLSDQIAAIRYVRTLRMTGQMQTVAAETQQTLIAASAQRQRALTIAVLAAGVVFTATLGALLILRR